MHLGQTFLQKRCRNGRALSSGKLSQSAGVNTGTSEPLQPEQMGSTTDLLCHLKSIRVIDPLIGPHYNIYLTILIINLYDSGAVNDTNTFIV